MRVIDAFRLTSTALALALLVGTNALQAQQSEDGHDHGVAVDGHPHICGTHSMAQFDNAAALERTRINNPELYARMVERAKYGIDMRSVLSQSEAILPFFVSDRDTPGEYTEIEAALRYEGDSILIWVDVKDTARIHASTIAALAHGLTKEVPTDKIPPRNPNQGVLYNDMEIFGRPPVNLEYPEYLVSFLLTDIEEPSSLSGGVIEGYFSSWDQTNNLGSNRQNILYIDNRQGLGNQSQEAIDGVVATMAHELQHLINHARYTSGGADNGTHWIYNEGLSEVASLRNGFAERSANPFIVTPNKYAFFASPGGTSTGLDILRAYERAMLWIHYISERFGDDLLYELTAQNGQGVEPLQKALLREGRSENADDVYAEFWVANYIANNPNFTGDEKFEYRFALATQPMGRTASPTLPTTETTKQDLLLGHGAVAYRYANPDEGTKGLRATFEQADRNYAVHAVITRANNAVEVQRLAIGQEYTFERFKDIAFVIVNLYGDGNMVDWSIAPIATGVEEYASDPNVFAIAGMAPNPVSGEGRLSFMTAQSGAISLELYDLRGRQVSTVLDGMRFEAGEHTILFETAGLQPGVYTARLRDAAGQVAVRQIVVVR